MQATRGAAAARRASGVRLRGAARRYYTVRSQAASTGVSTSNEGGVRVQIQGSDPCRYRAGSGVVCVYGVAQAQVTERVSVASDGTAVLPGGVTGEGNLSGTDRYQTNMRVAGWAVDHGGLSPQHSGIATGNKFPDALASGPYLARHFGILLLSPLTGPLPTPIEQILVDNASKIDYFTFLAMIEPVVGQVKSILP